jgi:DNA-binding transcriptional MerR regulator
MKHNLDIRKTAKEKGVYLWQIADYLGMHDTNFSKLLRKELPTNKRKEILQIIDELAKKEASSWS